ncbi:MAG TPA: dihydrodipicolinate synthase family protein [Verrucomicrobiae bacterium]|jgi:4-hydroxy-tetrahydrodipicolinate synthase
MKNGIKFHGVVVPMVTPITPAGELDFAAVDRLVDSLLAGGVEGVFVLGTTGEGASVPRATRRQLVERAVRRVAKRALVYAGAGDTHPEAVVAGNEYFQVGADVVVCRPPISFPPEQLTSLYQNLLEGLNGPLVIYNIPATTNVSIPLDLMEKFAGHPKLAGVKDSENNPQRIEELLKRFGGRKDFSVFIGVGALMEKGLKLGADGIVPSVGNLIPEICKNLCDSAQNGNWPEADNYFLQMNAVAALYQKGRTLNESLSVLKAALHIRGLCAPHVLPPLKPLSENELKKLREEMSHLHLLNGK